MSQLRNLSRDQLLVRLHELVARDQIAEGELVAHLGEVDARRLYLAQACPSMFHYCVHLLHFAEGVAYKRIAVARASRRFPEMLVALRGGDLHLTAASLLPDVDPLVTRSRRGSESSATTPSTRKEPAHPAQRDTARCEPLGAKRYYLRLVFDEAVYEELQELRALLRHQIPDGDVAKVLERAIRVLLEQVRKQKTGVRSGPAMVAAALMCQARADGANPVTFWSFTISCPGPAVANTRSPTSRCAAVPTINTKPRWPLAPSTWLRFRSEPLHAEPLKKRASENRALDLNPVRETLLE